MEGRRSGHGFRCIVPIFCAAWCRAGNRFALSSEGSGIWWHWCDWMAWISWGRRVIRYTESTIFCKVRLGGVHPSQVWVLQHAVSFRIINFLSC